MLSPPTHRSSVSPHCATPELSGVLTVANRHYAVHDHQRDAHRVLVRVLEGGLIRHDPGTERDQARARRCGVSGSHSVIETHVRMIGPHRPTVDAHPPRADAPPPAVHAHPPRFTLPGSRPPACKIFSWSLAPSSSVKSSTRLSDSATCSYVPSGKSLPSVCLSAPSRASSSRGSPQPIERLACL